MDLGCDGYPPGPSVTGLELAIRSALPLAAVALLLTTLWLGPVALPIGALLWWRWLGRRP